MGSYSPQPLLGSGALGTVRSGMEMSFESVVGVVDAASRNRFERMLFRATRGE